MIPTRYGTIAAFEHVLSLARISTSLFITGARGQVSQGYSRMLDLEAGLYKFDSAHYNRVIEEQ